MFYHHIKTFIRNVRLSGNTFYINVLGLSLGIACFLFIALYVYDELTFDDHHENKNSVYLLQQFRGGFSSGGKLSTDLAARMPQVEKSGRLVKANVQVNSDLHFAFEPDFYFADSTMFDILTFKVVEQTSTPYYPSANAVLVSKATAIRYFGMASPLGKTLKVNGSMPLVVTGVFEDLPKNSHIQPSFLTNYASANGIVGYDVTNNYWGGSGYTYLKLAENGSPEQLSAQFPGYLKSLNDPNAASVWELKLMPLKDLYLRTNFLQSSPMYYVYLFSFAALLVLVLACFNYINLATAGASRRLKATAVRKVLGSSLRQLRSGFLLETFLTVFTALLIALTIVMLCLPAFNQLSGKQFDMASVFSLKSWPFMVVLLVLVGLLAGTYPAIVLSRLQPRQMFSHSKGVGVVLFRKVLVGLQFAISILMILGAMVAIMQMNYMRSKKLGYSREDVLTVSLRNMNPDKKQLLKNEIAKLKDVEAVSISYAVPGSGVQQGQKLVAEFVPPGAKDASISMMTIDEQFAKVYSIAMKEGRMLDPNRAGDRKAYLVNEAAMRYFGWKDLTQRRTGYYTFEYRPDGSYAEVPQIGEVVGVVADYHHADLKQDIQPMIFALNSGYESELSVRAANGQLTTVLPKMSAVWKSLFPVSPFEFRMLDEQFLSTYKAEQRTQMILVVFAVLTILISCLGLYGLVSFAAEARKKEISVRRVLGANGADIVRMLSKDYLLLMGIAACVAIPFGMQFTQRWLQQFAYRTDVSFWLYGSALLMLLVICLGVVTWRTSSVLHDKPMSGLRKD
ncbi:MAG: FtsX-like permease family protein [Chitinophagaceae bacterium]